MEGGVTTKSVKLKVLYTFDSEHKVSHLARWPHNLEVQAAQVDETSLIGIINLRTCLEAVTTASPELATSTDNDYTVYAYDYSEPDTPLVGQGMLSKALTQEQSDDTDNEAMVTGRISKNVMGLFSKNALETLEVKLRFTPVTSVTYQHRRSGSICSNPEMERNDWSFSQAQNARSAQSPSCMDTTGLETMQRMLSENGPRDNSQYHHGSRPASRNGSIAPPQHLNQPVRQSGSFSRPSSRAGNRQVSHARRDSFNSGNSGYFSAEENPDDGPARKRARIQKVDPTASDFNIERQPDSLRVAASTASSVRLHRPVPQYPGISNLQSGHLMEETVRPPTPIPKVKPTRPRGRPKKKISANLLRGSARQSSPAFQQELSAETSLSSPEDVRAGSVTSTPADLPSSPPVMPEHHNFVTSPALPPLTTNETDSGFMSGNLDDLFDDQLVDFGDFLHEKPDGLDQDQQYFDLPAVFDDINDVEQSNADMPPPSEKPDPSTASRSIARSQSYTTGQRPLVPAPRLAPTLATRSGQPIERMRSSLPQVAASDPVERSFQRSNTWAPDNSDMIMSDIGPGNEDRSSGPKGKKLVGKEQTRARLENAIAQGQMPPFCDNCGAIQTPAWRRAFTKVFDTPYEEFQTSLEQGECCYKEPLEHNEDGTIRLWKGYRAEKKPDEKAADMGGWVQICLCNPCGLWFHKSKCPRPPEKWQKRDPNEKRKRKRSSKPKKRLNPPRPTTKSDAPTPASDDSSPADDGVDGEEFTDNMTVNDEPTDDNEPQLPPMPASFRAGSAEPVSRIFRSLGSRPNLRQVQSSPTRDHQHKSSVEIDITPKPLRRQLFPSPGSAKTQINLTASTTTSERRTLLPSFVRRSPRLNKTRDALAGPLEATAIVSVDGEGKENIAPLPALDDGLGDYFNMHDDDFLMPPTTPTPKRRSERILLKTPGKTPSHESSMSMSPSVRKDFMKTPKNKTHTAASLLINTIQRNLDPSEMTPFTRSIHDALNQPGSLGFHSTALEFPQTPQAGSSARSKRTYGKNTPRSNNQDLFNFPDLPSLNGSSPSAGANFGVNFSELTTDQINNPFNDAFSTDMAMPSSPPPGFFDFLDVKPNDMEGLWNEMDQQKNSQHTFSEIDDDGVVVAVPKDSITQQRRSPKKHTS